MSNSTLSQENEPLSATYAAPTSESNTFSHSLPQCPTNPSTTQRTEYIASLRTNVQTLQSEVNTCLTQKMEEDKHRNEGGSAKVDEDKEEENYGEEVVD